jgi:glycosyltransferase involved in cell wall biosynthesis
MDNVPVVSVCMITYNHEKYIAQAIESVLMQKVSFKLELIIGNDCSTDNTNNICLQYQQQYPDVVKLYTPQKNLGMMKNFIASLSNCTGKYIALCEGDDYWSDPYKLAKQVDFMEKNPQYMGCFHNTEERYEESDTLASFLYSKFSSARAIGFKELAITNYMPTCSVLIKNFDTKLLPTWYETLRLGDWTLHLINSLKGDYWYLPKVMAVHRLHSESTWMLQDQKKNDGYIVDAYNAMIGSGFFSEEQNKLLEFRKQKFMNKDSALAKVKRYMVSKLIKN